MGKTPNKIGRFPVIDTLGSGGMGVVYLAKDPDIERKVAIKILHASDDVALERFKNEARTIGGLTHPNIVTLLEYGIENKRPFLVMEFLPGQPLQRWVKRAHNFSEHRKILIGLCDALIEAHKFDILHRDLKPGNVQVLPSGKTKLLDFGIASSKSEGLTETGFFIGTPEYLAPEILEGDEHSKQSDCYSLALLAYHMLSGSNPFSSKSVEATITRKLTLLPPLLDHINPSIPSKLADIINTYLQKNKNQRPDSPLDLKKILVSLSSDSLQKKVITPVKQEEVLSQSESTLINSTSRKSRSNPWLMITTVVFSLIVIYTGFMFWNVDNSLPLDIAENSTQEKHSEIKTDAIPKTLQQNESTVAIPLQKEVVSQSGSTEIYSKTTPLSLDEKAHDTRPAKKMLSSAQKTKEERRTTQQQIKKSPIKSTPMTAEPTQHIEIKKEGEAQTSRSANRPITLVPNTEEISPPKEAQSTVIQLPTFNKIEKRLTLATNQSMHISKGEVLTLKLNLSSPEKIHKFDILRGTELTKHLQVLEFHSTNKDTTEIRVYAQPNATLGSYSIIAYYKNKQSSPIIIQVTL